MPRDYGLFIFIVFFYSAAKVASRMVSIGTALISDHAWQQVHCEQLYQLGRVSTLSELVPQ